MKRTAILLFCIILLSFSLATGEYDYSSYTDEELVSIISAAEDELARRKTSADNIMNQSEDVDSIIPGRQLSPIETIEGSILNVRDMGLYSGNNIEHSFYSITEGSYYFYTAACSSNAYSYPAGAFYDNNGNLIMTFGESAGMIFENVLVKAPAHATTCVLNKNNGLKTLSLKEAIVPSATPAQTEKYNLDFADALIRLEKRNPFKFAPMNEGYVTFIFDDLTYDIDTVAAVFAEYNYPACFAAIPIRLSEKANGLSAPKGDYTVGMTMQEVLTQAVADGGEVLVHNRGPAITEESQYDYEFMYGYFVQSKQDLINAGFRPRGIIRAGGANAILRSPEIDRWLIGCYEYANMGTLPQYNWDRVDTNGDLSAMKEAIDRAYTDHTWVVFMCHGLDAYHHGEAMSDESRLREILTYCQTKGINTVTCSYIFDHYSSSTTEIR